MVYLLFLFAPQQTILQARACIQREMTTLKEAAAAAAAETRRHKTLVSLHGDALSLLDCVSEMPANGLVVTENVCFDTSVCVPDYAYYYDDSGTSAAIKERIAYYYTSKHQHY